MDIKLVNCANIVSTLIWHGPACVRGTQVDLIKLIQFRDTKTFYDNYY